MRYSLGVDLGTTVVTAAVAGPSGVRVVALGRPGPGAPAVVHVGHDDTVVVGDEAERRAAISPDRAVRGLRRLGDDRPVVLGAAAYPKAGLLGAQLRDVVRQVTRAEGAPPDRVVLTCPASWDDARRARLEEVAAAARVAAPLVVAEPVAAVTALAPALAARWSNGDHVAVFDLGGGGAHASVVRRLGDAFVVVGTPEGDERFGGLDVDAAVLRHVAEIAGVPVTADGAALDRLRRACVRAKEALSTQPEATVPVSVAGRSVEVRVTRRALEDLVREPLGATMQALHRTIRSAGLLPSDVRAVVLLGGSSAIPLVAEVLSQRFGRPLVRPPDPKTPVALGAALVGARALEAPGVGVAAVGAPARGGPVTGPGTAPGRVVPAGGGTVAPILTAPTPTVLGDGQGVPPDPASTGPTPEGGARHALRRAWLPIAAGAVAVLVLLAVFVLTPGRAPTPPAVPAGAPPVAEAPAAATTAGPPSTRGATTSEAPARTTARSATTTRSRSTTRATRTRTATPTTTASTTKKKR